MKKIWRSCTALLMALCLIFGVCSTGLAAGLADYGITEEDLMDMLKDGTIKIEEIDLEKVEELIDSGAVEIPEGKKDTLLDLVDQYNKGDLTVDELIDEVKKEDITVEIKDETAIMDAVQNGAVKVEANISPEQLLKEMLTGGKLNSTIIHYANIAKAQAKQMWNLLEKNLKPAAASMKAELKVLYADLAAKLNELDAELAPYVAQQEAILADLVAEHDALVAELEALNAKLEAVKNGTYVRSAMVFSAKEEMIAELEADIAVTEAQIAELEETIAWVANQLKTDKSGIEAIKAAIADIKANIIATEAALAEVNAAIDQLAADLAALNEALEVLVDAAEYLAGKTAVKVDIEALVEAVKVVIHKVPAIIEGIEATYEKVTEVIEMAEAAVAEIKAAAAEIEETVKNLIASAEEFAAIAGIEAEIIKQYAEEMAAIVEAFVEENQPKVEATLEKTYKQMKELALEKLAKLEAKWNQKKDTVYAALAIGYMYCVNNGYVAKAKELILEYTTITQEDIDAIKADLSNAETVLLNKLAEAEAWLLSEKAALEAKLTEMGGKLEAHVVAELNAKLAEINAKLAEIDAKIAAVKDYFAEVYAAIEAVKAAIADVVAAIEAIGKDVNALCAAVKNLKNAVCELNKSVVALHDAVVNEVNVLLGYCGLIADEAVDVVETLANYIDLLGYIPAIIEEAYIDAITDNYLVSQDSHFVALGDKNVYGAAADKLAAHLSDFLFAEVSYDNLTQKGQSAAELLAVLAENADSLEKADLVTIGFGANTFTQFVVDQLKAALSGETPAELDWEAYLGENGAAYVAEAMAKLYAEVEASGAVVSGIDAASLVVLAVESYAYAYVEFAVSYIQVIEGVHAINPNAQVVLVGMHNPMAGVVLDVEGVEIAIGDYLQYLVDLSNLYSLGYAFVIPQTIFVDAPAVETENASGNVTVAAFVMDLLFNGTSAYVPTEEGYAYIEEQIWNALNVYKQGMLGDVNHDGKINSKDAVLVLRYATKLIGADALDLDLADVNGDGVYNSKDAVLILRFATGQITVFPAN